MARARRPAAADRGDGRHPGDEQAGRVSADLRRRGFRFVGSTMVYAFMQSAGVNDHVAGCPVPGLARPGYRSRRSRAATPRGSTIAIQAADQMRNGSGGGSSA